MGDLRVLILAAGKSTRMKSRYAKVLHRVAGRTLIEHVLDVARNLSTDIAVVVGHSADQVKAAISEVTFIDQTEQLGTGHAVLAARDHFSRYSGDVLVMPGDVPLISTSTLDAFVRFHREGGFRASVLTAEVDDPRGYGRIVRSSNSELDSIVEHRDATSEVLKIREINSGVYVFNAPALFESLTKIRNDNAQREYYLTDVIGILGSRKQKIGAFKVNSAEEVLGINTRQELAVVDRVMRRRKCESLMTDGVTIIDPESVYIDDTVEIGHDTVIYPSVQIYGQTVIGEEATIHSFSRISNSKVNDRSVVLEGCIVVDSVIGEDVSIGPYAHLRMGTTVGNSAKFGNFVEIKKSELGAGTKSMHLAYLGDATIGKNVNIGAGVITC
ncbi:MAG TPA: bifunctional UDP-N-acetylglucosamine diphosphorylase/glucosamine-1-phosphate N-acetyltransferase GlmU, partial [Terriglobia bacterium]|nr:bifunctional UDP-N-acetylglucosamine diphosphorylase/glucosamine-1-phosphate N-acetyltransferase GlmU [Terriglobia bacterium]